MMMNPAQTSEIQILSAPSPADMDDAYLDVASFDHFWVARRFAVFQNLARRGRIDIADCRLGDIGCGHGLVQQQIVQAYGTTVDGIELNLSYLERSLSPGMARLFYNIFDRRTELKGHYDGLFLFDVIEHIDNDQDFLDAAGYHLKPGGFLCVNVPALMMLFSNYDRIQGHRRRYTLEGLEQVVSGAGFDTIISSYWGFPYLPLGLARKFKMRGNKPQANDYRTGFLPPSRLANQMLGKIGQLEMIPQRFAGTSAMAIFQKKRQSE